FCDWTAHMACSWTQRFRLFLVTLTTITQVAATLTGLSLPARAADPAVPLPLLKQFVEEFVEIRPGQDKFPAELPGEPAGESTAGKTTSPVRLPAVFAMGRYEVPQNLYEA